MSSVTSAEFPCDRTSRPRRLPQEWWSKPVREQLFDIVSLSVGARIDPERESFRLIQRDNRSSDVEIVNLQGGRGDQGGCCNDGARATIAARTNFEAEYQSARLNVTTIVPKVSTSASVP